MTAQWVGCHDRLLFDCEEALVSPKPGNDSHNEFICTFGLGQWKGMMYDERRSA